MEKLVNVHHETINNDVPRSSFAGDTFEYQYVSHDHLRNNRPSWPTATPTHKSDQSNKSENTDYNPIGRVKTSRMASSLDDYEVISTIGTGSYGTCKKIRRKKDGKIMVWKEMQYGTMTESEKQMLVSEVNLLRELRHPHIVSYNDRIIDRNRTIIYIIMEYCQGGDLATIIAQNRLEGTHVPEEFAWKILIQTTLALKECHQRKNGKPVLHRDLKPANVFLDAESNVKLGDFGLARELRHDTSFAKTYVGTPYYMSPELVNNQSYNEKSDIWALGCMMYELCTLAPPFTGSNQIELNRKIRIGDYPRLPSQYSLELDMIIRKMIQVEVSRRPSIDGILTDPLVQRMKDSCLSHKNFNRLKRRDSAPGGNINGAGDQAAVRYEDIFAKMRQLELKEKELESRERSISLREKCAEEKFKRALDLMEKCRSNEMTARCFAPQARTQSPCAGRRRVSPPAVCVIPIPRSNDRACPVGKVCPMPSPRSYISKIKKEGQTSPHPCLSNGPKDQDSPKKNVTFHDYLNGKENLRKQRDGKGPIFDTYTGAYNVDSVQGVDQIRHEDIKKKLFKARERTVGIRDITMDAKFASRNLLYFR